MVNLGSFGLGGEEKNVGVEEGMGADGRVDGWMVL